MRWVASSLRLPQTLELIFKRTVSSPCEYRSEKDQLLIAQRSSLLDSICRLLLLQYSGTWSLLSFTAACQSPVASSEVRMV